jgi:class 3 adenylate cyclase
MPNIETKPINGNLLPLLEVDSHAHAESSSRVEASDLGRMIPQKDGNMLTAERATIMIVDDNDGFRQSLESVLSKRYVVICCASGEEALQKFTAAIDTVLLDIRMPGMDGLETCRRLQAMNPFVPIIFVTGHEGEYEPLHILQTYHPFSYVVKGGQNQILMESVHRAVEYVNLRKSQKKLDFLKRYFDPQVFDVIDKNPALLNLQARVATIVFWDVRGFSWLCEVLRAYPALIAGFLREYFQVASDTIFKHEGVLDKFIGDGIMAIFGALWSDDGEGRQCAVRAVQTAMELRDCFDQIMGHWVEQWALYTPQTIGIGLGCGIHTGEMLVGNVGTESRDQFTVLGPHVNFAQRIESRADRRQILMSASTKVRIAEHFEVNKVGIINDVKNIPGEFEIFEVVKVKE